MFKVYCYAHFAFIYFQCTSLVNDYYDMLFDYIRKLVSTYFRLLHSDFLIYIRLREVF